MLRMISLFQSSKSSSVSKSEGRALSLLTQALKLNLIRAKGLNHVELSHSLDELSEIAELGRDQAQVVEASGKACGAVRVYFEHLGQSIDAVGLDLATSVRALATILHGSNSNREEFLGGIDAIRDKFQAGNTLDDIHQLRQHLQSCLTSLRSELFHARKTQQENQSAVLEHLSQLHRSVSTLRAKDSTGPALSILRIRRLNAVRNRYGAMVANSLLDLVIQILLERWPAACDITPYGDECLVVLDSQNLDLDFHRVALRKLSAEKHVFTFQREGHDVILPIALDWTVIRAPGEGDMEEFISHFLEGMALKDNQSASLDKALGLRG